jgi:ABC-type hemin transport system ATPase subunit
VREVVAMGRTPHKRLLDGDTPDDADLIRSALAAVDATDLAHRPFDRLSGGERHASSSHARWPSSRLCSSWTSRPTISTSGTSWTS